MVRPHKGLNRLPLAGQETCGDVVESFLAHDAAFAGKELRVLRRLGLLGARAVESG
jgi:hypothetical protein